MINENEATIGEMCTFAAKAGLVALAFIVPYNFFKVDPLENKLPKGNRVVVKVEEYVGIPRAVLPHYHRVGYGTVYNYGGPIIPIGLDIVLEDEDGIRETVHIQDDPNNERENQLIAKIQAEIDDQDNQTIKVTRNVREIYNNKNQVVRRELQGCKIIFQDKYNGDKNYANLEKTVKNEPYKNQETTKDNAQKMYDHIANEKDRIKQAEKGYRDETLDEKINEKAKEYMLKRMKQNLEAMVK